MNEILRDGSLKNTLFPLVFSIRLSAIIRYMQTYIANQASSVAFCTTPNLDLDIDLTNVGFTKLFPVFFNRSHVASCFRYISYMTIYLISKAIFTVSELC